MTIYPKPWLEDGVTEAPGKDISDVSNEDSLIIPINIAWGFQ